jgi:hypothetical protein
MDSMVYFSETIDLAPLEKFMREQRAAGMQDLRLVHVIVAACVRLFSQKPRLNRFVAGKKIYSRNCIRISMAIKRKMSEDGEETIIIPQFEPEDTIADVVTKFNVKLAEGKAEAPGLSGNETDVVAKIIGACPTFLKTFVVFLIRALDSVGCMPKFIYDASPFHSSLFITDVGSLGIRPIHHHLYEFGTCSAFIAIGKKETQLYLDAEGKPAEKKVLGMSAVLDERTCDGFYNASAMKLLHRILKHPEQLLNPPEKVVLDN